MSFRYFELLTNICLKGSIKLSSSYILRPFKFQPDSPKSLGKGESLNLIPIYIHIGDKTTEVKPMTSRIPISFIHRLLTLKLVVSRSFGTSNMNYLETHLTQLPLESGDVVIDNKLYNLTHRNSLEGFMQLTCVENDPDKLVS